MYRGNTHSNVNKQNFNLVVSVNNKLQIWLELEARIFLGNIFMLSHQLTQKNQIKTWNIFSGIQLICEGLGEQYVISSSVGAKGQWEKKAVRSHCKSGVVGIQANMNRNNVSLSQQMYNAS